MAHSDDIMEPPAALVWGQSRRECRRSSNSGLPEVAKMGGSHSGSHATSPRLALRRDSLPGPSVAFPPLMLTDDEDTAENIIQFPAPGEARKPHGIYQHVILNFIASKVTGTAKACYGVGGSTKPLRMIGESSVGGGPRLLKGATNYCKHSNTHNMYKHQYQNLVASANS